MELPCPSDGGGEYGLPLVLLAALLAVEPAVAAELGLAVPAAPSGVVVPLEALEAGFWFTCGSFVDTVKPFAANKV